MVIAPEKIQMHIRWPHLADTQHDQPRPHLVIALKHKVAMTDRYYLEAEWLSEGP